MLIFRAHASNAYMLHALGITHVVSVGECALVPPQANCSQAAEYRFSYGGKVLGAGPGSLWIEEREERIKVLDIKVSTGILP
jgi:dual specificity MAP kinase phosphatase